MSMRNGSQRRSSPSIVARLMGLDGMPPHIEPKPLENQQRRPSDKARGKQTYRSGSMNEQRFKDVFEVLDADEGQSSTSLYQRRRLNPNLNEAEMAFIEARRLSNDEKLRYSKEFSETLEALDSNKDLLFQFLHQPDSLFTKEFHGLHSIAPQPHCSQATTLKFSNRESLVNNIKALKVDREFSGKRHRPPQWHGDGVDLSKKSGLKPTEIVVLKPNLGKPQTCAGTLPSQSDEAREDLRLPCTSNQESKASGSLKGNEDVFLLRNKPRDSREIARIVSRQLKASCGNESSINFDMSRFRVYTGDESSSGSDSSRARTEFTRKKHSRSVSSRSPESASKEAMRRMSERWKLAHNSKKEMEIRRRNTLADMLATSDREARLASFSRTTFQERLSKRFERQSELPDPLGISSRDGWKGTGRRNLSKSRPIMHKDRTCSHMIVLPKKLTTRDGLVKGSSLHIRENNSHFSDISSSEINRPSSSKSLKTQRSLSIHADSDTESSSDYEDAKSNPSLEPLDLSAVTSLTDHPQEIAEEGDQPSPQTSLDNEFSSNSECFESLSADLQGLRMRLQLLKRESDTYNEGDMLVSSEEEEETSKVTDETMIIHELVEDWKSLYLTDILANSRFSDLNPTSFMASWHSSESPLDPSLFDDLEKKYYFGLKTSTRLERKFVFDWINSEILEFFEQFTDLKPTKISPKWDISRIHETLLELVTRKHMKQSRDTKEMLLPSLEDGIEVIGKEIEEMLIDEFIAEFVIRVT
ncbi:unnamed protein product [Eruca vesicaria subsp. sativa]|uniref:Uncharacterized protein n=1 Tax=Eruca vesicaria subsp. sativa TaxID=29727 RepID=A0ABC8JU89_ERUVS|nr:unnamed protein product [Eruca vesicaria subsp. sativa]